MPITLRNLVALSALLGLALGSTALAQAFTPDSLRGTYAILFTAGANVGGGLGTCSLDGVEALSCTWTLNFPFDEAGPAMEGERVRVPMVTTGSYTVGADGAGTMTFVSRYPDDSTYESSMDFAVTAAEPTDSGLLATEIAWMVWDPSLPAAPGASLGTGALRRIADDATLTAQAAARAAAPAPESNEQIVRRFIDAWVAADAAALEALLAPDFVNHTDDVPPDRATNLQMAADALAAFPDQRYLIEHLEAAGDAVAVQVQIQGTHQGEFNGVPATGRTFDFPATIIFRLRDGQIAERWGTVDLLTFMTQIGMELAPGEGMVQASSEPASTEAATTGEDAAGPLRQLDFTAELTGEAMVPAVATEAGGAATAVLVGNRLVVTGSYHDLGSDVHEMAPVFVHHAPAGENGPAVRLARARGGVGESPTMRLLHEGGRTGIFSGVFDLTAEQVEELKAGRYYVNVHTENHPLGELRGQLTSTLDLDLTTDDLVGTWFHADMGWYYHFTDDGAFFAAMSTRFLESDPSNAGRYQLDGNLLTAVSEGPNCPEGATDVFLVDRNADGTLRILDRRHLSPALNCGGIGANSWETLTRVDP